MSFIIVYITHGNEISARKLSNYLVENKLVACANIFPIKSAYWWKGAVQSDNEFVSIVKSVPELWNKLQATVEDIHPYDVPCIMKINAEANESYEKWIRDSVSL